MSLHPILHVEDSEEDVFLVRYAFKRTEIINPVQVVTDGQMAIDYLAGSGKFSERTQFPLPGLMLLDLKLPHMTGMEVFGVASTAAITETAHRGHPQFICPGGRHRPSV